MAAMSFVVIDKPRPHVTLVTLNRPERMNAGATNTTSSNAVNSVMLFAMLSAGWSAIFSAVNAPGPRP